MENFTPAILTYTGFNKTVLNGFTVGQHYEAYFLDYYKNKRDRLHIKNDYNELVKNVPRTHFLVVSDPNGILQHKHAKVQFVKNNIENVLYRDNVYHALGRDKDGLYYVKYESGKCDFFPPEFFTVKSDAFGLLKEESMYFSSRADGELPEVLDNIDYAKSNYYYGRHIWGNYTYVSKGRVVGFCHYNEHSGYLTMAAMKERGCLAKECRYFEKNEDHPFWSLQENKDKKKTIKQAKAKNESQERELVVEAQECADFLDYNIKITSVKNDPKSRKLIIYYVSDLPEDDYHRFLNLARAISGSKHMRTELRHVKDIDGNYATFRSLRRA